MDTDYMNVEDLLPKSKDKIYQIQINNDKIMVKHIGYFDECPDIIIAENLGKNKNLSLYSCVYKLDELVQYNSANNLDKLFPIIKLTELSGIQEIPNPSVYSIAVKFNSLINFDGIGEDPCEDFDIFFVYAINPGGNFSLQKISQIKINKTVNTSNIIEVLLQHVVDLGFNIL